MRKLICVYKNHELMTWALRTDHKEVQGVIDPLDRIVGFKSECIIKTH